VEVPPGLDPGIEREVRALMEAGVETYESCEGGMGHAFPEPTVRFYGEMADGYLALGAALRYDFPVTALRRLWRVYRGEIASPVWELTFKPLAGREWWIKASDPGLPPGSEAARSLAHALAMFATIQTARAAHAAASFDVIALGTVVVVVVTTPVFLALRVVRGNLRHMLLTSPLSWWKPAFTNIVSTIRSPFNLFNWPTAVKGIVA